jgi:TPR repeat protein
MSDLFKAVELYETDNFSEAYPLFYRFATKEKDDEAQFYLGLMYYNGEYVEKDMDEAYRWWLKAARAGNSDASFRLDTIASKTSCRC